MRKIEQGGYVRITKPHARKLHSQGVTVYIQCANFRPVNPWQSCHAMPSAQDMWKEVLPRDFNWYVAQFEIYNCNDRETGLYASFYVAKDDLAPNSMKEV